MKQRKNLTDRFFAKYFNNQILTNELIENIDDTIYNNVSLKLQQHKNVENSIDFNQYCFMIYNKIKKDINNGRKEK